MSRTELEEQWRQRVKDAKLRLDFAVQTKQKSPADRQASREERIARAEYMKALKIYETLFGSLGKSR
jgi:hypothetical protein